MSDDERKVLIETAIALAAVIEGLADGNGLADWGDLRSKFRERISDEIVGLASSATESR